jgi:hypothetical protein
VNQERRLRVGRGSVQAVHTRITETPTLSPICLATGRTSRGWIKGVVATSSGYYLDDAYSYKSEECVKLG